MAQQIGVIQTLYDSREKKGIKVKFNPQIAAEIETYLTGLEGLIETYKDKPEIVQGLSEVKVKANALLISNTPEDEIIGKIRKMTTVKGPDGRKMNITAFGKGKSLQVNDESVFKERTLKRLNQTIQNTMALMQWDSENKDLGGFLADLRNIDQNLSGRELDKLVKSIVNSEYFSAYQKSKEAYLREWLKPFQDELGKPVESLTQEELQEAMKRMKIVMKQRLNEGNLVIHPNSDDFKDFNAHDHDMVNGNEKSFWLNDLLIDEFINFTQAVLSRFTFLLDKKFLVFQFKNEPYLYLIGFSHDAFLNAEQSDDGSLLITPHAKPIMQRDKTYREVNKSGFPSVGLYTDVLKDTLKPFLIALAEKIGFEFSKEFKMHFRM